MKMIYKYRLGMDIHHNAVYEVDMPRNVDPIEIKRKNNSYYIYP